MFSKLEFGLMLLSLCRCRGEARLAPARIRTNACAGHGFLYAHACNLHCVRPPLEVHANSSPRALGFAVSATTLQ